jgi:hypothetical protein
MKTFKNKTKGTTRNRTWVNGNLVPIRIRCDNRYTIAPSSVYRFITLLGRLGLCKRPRQGRAARAANRIAMDSFDSANLLSGGSRLLSQSPQFSFNSASSSSAHTGPGGDDFSLSELNLTERETQTQTQTRPHNAKSRTRPSIAQALGFGAAALDQSDDLSVLGALEEDAGEEREEEEGIEAEAEAEADVTVRVGHGEDAEKTGVAAQSREEKLQSDLFVLRQLNGAFAVYNDALREAQGGTEVSPKAMPSRGSFFFLSFSHTTAPQASRRATGTDRRTTQQIHQYFIQVR